MNLRIGKSAAGFTLLEVMIALAILAGMTVVMFMASSQMMDAQESFEARDEQNHAVAFALTKMTEDLESAFMVKSGDMLGPKFGGTIAFVGGENRLDFVGFAHLRYIRNAKESDVAELSYYLRSDEENPESQVLMRREATQLDKDIQQGGQSYPLLSGVRSLTFEYLPDGSEEYKKTWDTNALEASNRLPRAVKIVLEVQIPGEEEPKTYTSLVRLPMGTPLQF